ncbi:Hypothetical predicted protein [Pelobates cultripes]|uniref:Neugrin n=1 Tax=Pelobates cultripes TaxID=61616 RepID=A0AAD1RN09_PELCU|nr:Hypothetical predicted protein [Pelobates cultripes]
MAAAGLTPVWRLRALITHSVSALTGRLVTGSGPCYSSLPGDDHSTETGFQSEEDDIEDIKRALKRQQKAIKFQKIKREFEPRGPPERILSWNAIQQIRYLKQNFPEEWTVPRLAEGFNVSVDVIRRVLRSNFSPPEKRKLKQDVKVAKLLGQSVPKESRKDVLHLAPAAKDSAVQLLSSGLRSKQIRTPKHHVIPPSETSPSSAIALRGEGKIGHVRKENFQLSTQQSQINRPGMTPAMSYMTATIADNPQSDLVNVFDEEQENLDEEWDGEVLSDHELEELAESGIKNQMQVVQQGREFFDSNGNFLYRI